MLHLAAFTHQRLWFDIVRLVSTLHSICEQVRAGELLNQRRLADGAGVAMLEQRLSLPPRESISTAPPTGPAAVDEQGMMMTQRPMGPCADVVVARQELRRLLGFLKSRLAEALTEREVYHLLFPLVIYTDELLNQATDGGAMRWEPLQGELYDVDNGGELFFSTVDTLLHKDDTHPLVFEVYYFCLLDGFVGQYDGQPGKIQEYRRRIAERIPVEAVPTVVSGRQRAVRLVPFPLRTYLLSVAAVAVLLSLLVYWARSDIESHRALFEPASSGGASVGGGMEGRVGDKDG